MASVRTLTPPGGGGGVAERWDETAAGPTDRSPGGARSGLTFLGAIRTVNKTNVRFIKEEPCSRRATRIE